ncbi:hypothetical protein ACXX82_00995 [Glaciimonas sp. GNP009]
MDTWHIDVTQKLIQYCYSRSQLKLAQPSLQSIIQRQEFAKFHYHEANDLFSAFASKRLSGSSILQVAFGVEIIRDDFYLFMTKFGAHVLACLQSLHAIPDILAHAIYYSTGLDRSGKPIKEAAINVKTVLERLEQTSDLEEVCRYLTSLVDDGYFGHLTALSNHSKHRSIIPTSLSEDMTGKVPERHQLKLAAFTYKKVNYPETCARDFIELEFNRISKLVVDIGNAINTVLHARSP